jgi:hypothetical protein
MLYNEGWGYRKASAMSGNYLSDKSQVDNTWMQQRRTLKLSQRPHLR